MNWLYTHKEFNNCLLYVNGLLYGFATESKAGKMTSLLMAGTGISLIVQTTTISIKDGVMNIKSRVMYIKDIVMNIKDVVMYIKDAVIYIKDVVMLLRKAQIHFYHH